MNTLKKGVAAQNPMSSTAGRKDRSIIPDSKAEVGAVSPVDRNDRSRNPGNEFIF
jgi:hypothetical protein